MRNVNRKQYSDNLVFENKDKKHKSKEFQNISKFCCERKKKGMDEYCKNLV